MRRLRVLVLSIFLWLACNAVAANSGADALQVRHRFRHLTIEQGLSQSSVNCILQDRFGYVWLGTQDGLNRHDGYNFLVWKTDADDPLTLSDAYITCLAEDAEGHLWVGSEASGFARFNRVTQRFDYLCTGPQRAADEHGTNYGIQDLAIDAQGMIWVATSAHGLLRHDPRTGEQRFWQHGPDGLPSNEVTALRLDTAGRLWIGTAAGLARLDASRANLQVWQYQPDRPESLPVAKIDVIHESAAGVLWLGSKAGLHHWDPLHDVFVRQDGIAVGVEAMAEDAAGRLWLGSLDNYVIRLDPRTGEQLVLAPDLSSPTCLQTGKIQAVFVDAAGVVWVGHDLGASLLDIHAKEFFHFRHEVGQVGSLSNNTVWAFCEDHDDLVWIATNNGLNRFDPRTGLCEVFPADPQNRRRPSHDRMTAIFQDRRGKIWLGYAHGALNILDPATGLFEHVPVDSSGAAGAPATRVYAFAEAPDGTVWMATYDGLQSWDPQTGRYTATWRQPGGLFDLGGNPCKSLQIDRDGTIWVGTWGLGVLQIDPHTGTRRHYRHAAGSNQTITSDTILSLLLDRTGRLWVGTGSGLTRLDPLTGLGVRLTEKNGLPNNTIYAMSEDASGRIWAGTNFGLICLDPESMDFHHYQAKDGLQSNEFNMGAVALGHSGRMYVGGINGFNVFYPDRIQANPYVPPVLITDFQINNQRILAGEPNRGRELLTVPIYQTEQLVLDYRDHVVSFSFTTLHYAAPEKNRYAYRLEGFDADWTEAGGRTRATYTNLPAGNYVLRVRGTNSDGIWNESGAALKLRVRPPFWQTPWFLILATMLGLSALHGIIRYRTRLMKIRTQELEKRVARRTADLTRANHFLQQEITERRRMEEALRVAKDQAEDATRTKSEFLANMSHEIRTPMNGVLGMTSVLLEGELSPEHREHLEVVYASARNLLTIINDILDFSKIEAGKLELESIDFDLRSLAEEVAEMLAPRAFDKGLVFTLRVAHDIPAGLRGDPLRIRQILVNLVNNAVKFTEHGRVDVRVTMTAQAADHVSLLFEIQDTGVGIPADRMDRLFESFSQVDTSTTRQYGGTGLGLAICKQLVDLMHGEITVASEVGRGTTFVYRLDLARSQSPVFVESIGGRLLVILPDDAGRQAVVETLLHLHCDPVAPDLGGDPAQAAILALGQHPGCLAVMVGNWNDDPATRQVPRKLQAALGAAAPPCLALCRLGETVDGRELQAAGFAGWVSLPLRTRKLREVLHDLAARRDAGVFLPGLPAPGQEPALAPPTFPTTVPAAPDRTAGEPPLAPAAEADTASIPGLPVLLAEDNPVNQKVASILLRKLGYQVEVVDNGAEAVAALARRRYSLVFMDVQMPVMDGYEAVRRIRAGNDGVLEPRVPIIALTAHAMKGDRQRCLDAGMDDYLAKPIDQKALAAILEGHLPSPAPAPAAV
ncbi:MAG: two-component regulator propeller domain-containing protein [Candidatus Krumholzibacteria bacterium]|jgi:signal transduction histidine kinase/ligand-binding sensor domain-containing protein/CheY-like chemotaxis protein|nr:two-component regulator propeller domain-containing protein [Candidatus Krumholzibacteria bacterium]